MMQPPSPAFNAGEAAPGTHGASGPPPRNVPANSRDLDWDSLGGMRRVTGAPAGNAYGMSPAPLSPPGAGQQQDWRAGGEEASRSPSGAPPPPIMYHHHVPAAHGPNGTYRHSAGNPNMYAGSPPPPPAYGNAYYPPGTPGGSGEPVCGPGLVGSGPGAPNHMYPGYPANAHPGLKNASGSPQSGGKYYYGGSGGSGYYGGGPNAGGAGLVGHAPLGVPGSPSLQPGSGGGGERGGKNGARRGEGRHMNRGGGRGGNDGHVNSGMVPPPVDGAGGNGVAANARTPTPGGKYEGGYRGNGGQGRQQAFNCGAQGSGAHSGSRRGAGHHPRSGDEGSHAHGGRAQYEEEGRSAASSPQLSAVCPGGGNPRGLVPERSAAQHGAEGGGSVLGGAGAGGEEQSARQRRAAEPPSVVSEQGAKEDRDDGWGDDDGFGGGVSMVDINEIRNKHAMLAKTRATGLSPSNVTPPGSGSPQPSSSSTPSGSLWSLPALNADGRHRRGEERNGEGEKNDTLVKDFSSLSLGAAKKKVGSEVPNGTGGAATLSGVTSAPKEETERVPAPPPPPASTAEDQEDSKEEGKAGEESKREEGAGTTGASSGLSGLSKLGGGGGAWRPRSQRQFSREEELDRTVKALLNKLTIEKFDTITEKLARTVEGLKEHKELQLFVNVVMEKAVTEPDWSEMYADLCQVLQWRSIPTEGADIENFRKTPFMKALLTKIQAEYEAMPRTLQSRARSLPPGEVDPEAAEELQQLKRTKNRILGVVKLIGELFQRKILGFPIVRDVVVDLVIKNEEPDEHFIECFVQLIATTGYYIDQNPKMKAVLDSWFGRLTELQKKACYSKRLKCIIQDTLDMRKADWRKKIHKERAKALSDLREQLETEEVLGGSVHAAQYGNIVVVGQRSNLNGAYAGYLKEQQDTFERRVAKLRSSAGAPTPPGGASPGPSAPVAYRR